MGEMACGEYGMGRMSDPVTITNHINKYFKNKAKSMDLGKSWLPPNSIITTIPLRERQKTSRVCKIIY